jgi:hypothetical protein
MKAKIALAFLLLINTAGFSQANKFSKDDFGIRYGIYFNGLLSQQLTFLGMITDRVEIGSIISVQYNAENNGRKDSTFVSAISGEIKAERNERFKTARLDIGLIPYFAYHFPVKSNLDVSLGGYLGINIRGMVRDERKVELSAAGYSSINTIKNKGPLLYALSTGLTVGCQYFFYKNVAFGAQASLGAGYNFINGKRTVETESNNAGIDNPTLGINYVTDENKVNSSGFNLSTVGNVGINLTFYFSRKEKKGNK